MKNKREPVIIKISGSFIQPDKVELIRKYSKVLIEIYNKSYRPFVVVGGGKIARSYINAARELGENESILDTIGIEITRLNARLLISALKNYAFPFPPKNIEEFLLAINDPQERIIVSGGLQPGHSTNAVAAILAELVRAKLIINLTKVDGVYTSDPLKDSNAKLIKRIRTDELLKLLENKSSEAGNYELLDKTAIEIIKRSKLIVKILNGNDPTNIIKVLKGEDLGTTIIP